MTDRALDPLIEEITVDAYGDEGFHAFACYFVDEIGLPLRGLVVGEEVDVVDVFFDGDERRALSVRCRRNGRTHEVALIDIVFPTNTGEGPRLGCLPPMAGTRPLAQQQRITAAPACRMGRPLRP